jgi:hypothetical protein
MYCGSLFVWGGGFTMEIPSRSFRREEFVCQCEHWIWPGGWRRLEAVEGNSHFRQKDAEKTGGHTGGACPMLIFAANLFPGAFV